MRENLASIEYVRGTFKGEFVRTGIKNGFKGTLTTILLKNIKDINENIICDHLWFNLTKGFEKLKLQEGDKIQFDARVTMYEKGYKGFRDDVYKSIEYDYKLSYPTKISRLKI